MIRGMAAIVRADVLIRFRRLSTLIVFLLLSAFAWVWIPDPDTGRALMRIGNARVLYNSAAIGIGSAMLATLFTGLIGFYVVSNAIGADLRSRCGSVIASTDISSSAYLAGKLAGNTIFLATFIAGFMAVSMAMVVVRGEAPLQPLIFLEQYLLIVAPTIVLVSSLAIAFESVPLLSGRFGDVAYFFVWIFLMAGQAALFVNERNVEYFDFNGLAFVLQQVREVHHTTSVSIGAGPFDRALPVVILSGLRADAASVFARAVCTLEPLVLLLMARAFFHRFDPARVKAGARHASRRWGARLEALAKPLTRLVSAIPARSPVAADTKLTFTARPAALVALVAIAIASAASAATLPVLFAVAAVFISDVATRERRAGTTGFVYATSSLRERFVAWKLGSALAAAAILLAVPAVRLLGSRPSAIPAFAGGLFFVAATATALGIISSNPKTFIVLFLVFWYLVVNDRGATPALDFAGFYGPSSPIVIASYAAIAILLLVAAAVTHRARLQG